MRDSNNSLFEEALFAPNIPDYQMVRKIGGGAYGQVWMALSVTGAHRAIKIVAREDFRFEKTFEREFEGIKHFEPISRAHPGLVDILHVGRSFEENFYYYVMELADDQRAAPGVVDPYSYEPRTLRTDILAESKIGVSESIRVGMALADSLHYLHARGLSHRDVKPSNIIFVDGEPKLADIGLVAETGQQTFVGTEGFVPPEGPGTAKADIYSLGMVLYELTTGKDRLDFPELPEDLGLSAKDRRDWQALNGIICRCCTADQKQRYETASDLASQLGNIQAPASSWLERLSQPPLRNVAAGVILLGIVIALALPKGKPSATPTISKKLSPPPAATKVVANRPTENNTPSPTRPGPEPVSRAVTTMAEEAYFYTKQGREIGALPLSLNRLGKLPVDEGYVAAPGYGKKDVAIAQLINAQPLDQPISIALSRSPDPLQGWTNPLGIVFHYEVPKQRHRSVWPIGTDAFQRYKDQVSKGTLTTKNLSQVSTETLFPGSDCPEQNLVLTSKTVAESFCEWLNTEPSTKGWLRQDQRYRPRLQPVFAGRAAGTKLQLFYCEISTSS